MRCSTSWARSPGNGSYPGHGDVDPDDEEPAPHATSSRGGRGVPPRSRRGLAIRNPGGGGRDRRLLPHDGRPWPRASGSCSKTLLRASLSGRRPGVIRSSSSGSPPSCFDPNRFSTRSGNAPVSGELAPSSADRPSHRTPMSRRSWPGSGPNSFRSNQQESRIAIRPGRNLAAGRRFVRPTRATVR